MTSTGFPLLIFSDDWGRHPSSCQHLARHLLPRYPITWINTIGMRTPKLNSATFQRAAGKVREWIDPWEARNARPLPPGLRVRSPRMWPWLTRRIDRGINRRLLLRQLRAEENRVPAAITTLPIVADMMGRLNVDRWVYYCVDDFGEWPGLDRKAMSRMERIVIDKADIIVAASERLQERMRSFGRDSYLLSHGVDLDFWTRPRDASPQFEHLERPLIVFWGIVDRRMDTAFLRSLAGSLKRGTIVLAGPEQESDSELNRLARIHRTGPLPFESLPALARDAAVLIMPYADLPVTRAMQPLKLKEYLATGKPTVVRDLPANREWSDALDIASTADQFAAMVRERLTSGIPDGQRVARERLVHESWAHKAAQFERWIAMTESH